jgi:hypothetical protein
MGDLRDLTDLELLRRAAHADSDTLSAIAGELWRRTEGCTGVSAAHEEGE